MAAPKTAIILAAGLGTRLRPLTERVPKALVEVGGRAMIEYPLRMLAAAGVETIVVNLHHHGEQIRAKLGDGSGYGVRIIYSPEDPILDTGGAIARARLWLGDGPFFVANCDALLDVDLAALARFHAGSNALATLVVRLDPEADRYGPVDIDARGRIRRFLGSPQTVPDASLTRTMFSGVHVLSREIFEKMPRKEIFSITRDVYAPAHRGGAPLFGFRYDGYWKDAGTLASLEETRRDISGGRFVPGYFFSRAGIKG